MRAVQNGLLILSHPYTRSQAFMHAPSIAHNGMFSFQERHIHPHPWSVHTLSSRSCHKSSLYYAAGTGHDSTIGNMQRVRWNLDAKSESLRGVQPESGRVNGAPPPSTSMQSALVPRFRTEPTRWGGTEARGRSSEIGRARLWCSGIVRTSVICLLYSGVILPT